ncbi:hypothetical protein EUGRSUZ_L00735 [Eucalyptus grandis]|uniref:Uncharacterized protein n=1 Tax=Eucalyptus grandis TaxID=71139 RepID=A0A058ZW05_EUCGR|nr:hypothetical protein EUGRSUZ_L00735 [Eucalyptus grandis]
MVVMVAIERAQGGLKEAGTPCVVCRGSRRIDCHRCRGKGSPRKRSLSLSLSVANPDGLVRYQLRLLVKSPNLLQVHTIALST